MTGVVSAYAVGVTSSAGELAVSAADRVFRGGLRTGDSGFSPGLRAWSPEAVAQLRRCFVEKPDAGGDDFLTKLQRQLDDAPDEAVVLAAELLYLNMLPLHERQIGRPAKMHILTTVLAWTKSAPAQIPPDLDAAMAGFINGGRAFLTLRWAQLQFLILLVERLLRADPATMDRILAQPAEFRDLCNQVTAEMGNQKARAQVQVLLHLLFPDDFIDSASVDHKKQMREAFAPDYLSEDKRSGDLDRELIEIRRAMEAKQGSPVDFYAQPWMGQWRTNAAQDDTQRGWLIWDENNVSAWLSGNYCSLSWPEVATFPAKPSKRQIADAVDASLAQISAGKRSTARAQLYRFFTQMRDGDVIVTREGRKVHIGTVTGGVQDAEGVPADLRLRREVEWRTVAKPIPWSALSDQTRTKLSGQHGVSEVTDVVAELLDQLGPDAITVTDVLIAAGGTAAVELAPATEELAGKLLFPLLWLQDTITVLRRRRQVIFYGPPGTGKTHAARVIAEHVAPGNVRLVQFHPSYTYEDFFEGYRPLVEDGKAAFDLVDGPFKRLAEDARAAPEQAFVLIIDEINRANLAKVFGELYFLLEYRDAPVITQYSRDEPFALPKNVYLIGTMNTADRSIALVDAALRRRFAFRRLAPDGEPIAGLLRAWLKEHGLTGQAADLLDALNARLRDADRAIGPTYLMDELIDAPGELEVLWSTQILPLLEDQLYDTAQDIAGTFGLDALRKGLGAPPASSTL
jgi:5-methylcytosine-specific restriction enzyme B